MSDRARFVLDALWNPGRKPCHSLPPDAPVELLSSAYWNGNAP
jgi:hypothetical protein